MKYDFTQIETKWQKYWLDQKVYKSEICADKPKFYALIEFPFPSGVGLHICLDDGSDDGPHRCVAGKGRRTCARSVRETFHDPPCFVAAGAGGRRRQVSAWFPA